jgi:hypothetical protein
MMVTIREINDLEVRIATVDADVDDMRWEQAAKVMELLATGLSARKLAKQWINIKTGRPYDHTHVSRWSDLA